MSKRFTDTNLWEEDWFIDLPNSYQFFWIYLKDTCDHAGIWRPNISKFSKLFGHTIQLSIAIEKINQGKERVVLLQNGRLFLTGFIPFQYGKALNLSSRMHLSVYEALQHNEVNLTLIRPQIEVIARVKDKDKDKDKDISSSLGKESVRGEGVEIPPDLLESESEIRDWLAYKKERRQPYKSQGLKALWRRFRSILKERRRETVDYSMANGWSGLFEKNGGSHGQQGTHAGSNRAIGEPERTDSKYAGIVKTVRVGGPES